MYPALLAPNPLRKKYHCPWWWQKIREPRGFVHSSTRTSTCQLDTHNFTKIQVANNIKSSKVYITAITYGREVLNYDRRWALTSNFLDELVNGSGSAAWSKRSKSASAYLASLIYSMTFIFELPQTPTISGTAIYKFTLATRPQNNTVFTSCLNKSLRGVLPSRGQ